MAGRAQPVNPWIGIGAAALVAALILATLVSVAMNAQGGGLTRADWAALRFTVLQALLSAGLSCVLAIPVARALARRRFTGRRIVIALLGAPFILPVIVAIFGLLEIFGRAGLVSWALGLMGFEPIRIYGLHGVVLAHVFFNLPLATRLILQAWQEIPAERFRLAASLGLDRVGMFRLIEVPMLARILPGVFAVIFAVCLTSFAVALTLGGGPRATTIELAIYQAFTFDFDLARAAWLGLIQLGLTVAAASVALALARDGAFGTGLDRVVRRWDGGAPVLDGLVIGVAATFLLLPIGAVIFSGLSGVMGLPAIVFRAAGVSIVVALVSTAILIALALPMAASVAAGRARGVEIAGLLGLAASPLVIGTGLFIAVRPFADPIAWALPVTALVNALMALPFALRILVPAARNAVARHGRLAVSLGMSRTGFFMRILIPAMRPQIGFAAGLGAALSMGDLGVIALFANSDVATLPLQIYRLMGAYRMEAAAGATLILLMLSFGAFWAFDRGGRGHAEA
ncbi:MAG: thiamine/thiamine pyrophosphate ABC transporter permease ThiP [Pseudomonadota bacterium]